MRRGVGAKSRGIEPRRYLEVAGDFPYMYL